MNGVPEYFELKLAQTSKGIWYCDSFTVRHENRPECITMADDGMTKIEEILDKHNKEE